MYRDWQNTIRTAINKGLEEGREKGLAEGREKGRAEGLEKGRAEGRQKGLAEGRQKGLAEGLEKGRAEEKAAIARNLKSLGLTTAQIAQATGLPAKEIDKL